MRRELSNATVKSDFRLTDVEIWPFPFLEGFFKGAVGSLGLPGRSLGVPGLFLGGSEASMGVTVSASEHFFVIYRRKTIYVFVIPPEGYSTHWWSPVGYGADRLWPLIVYYVYYNRYQYAGRLLLK